MTPVTVTVCGAFQFKEVNVNDAGDTVPSVVSLLLIAIETSDVGSEFKTTVNVACTPASVVVKSEAKATVIPGVAGPPLPSTPSSSL